MKKTAAFFTILAFPAVLWAMEPISDSELSDVLGKSGVSIMFDITMNVGIGTIGWGDPDGAVILDGDPDAEVQGGWVGIDSLTIKNLHIWPRTDFLMNTDPASGTRKDLQPLTIDVITVPTPDFHR